MSAGNVSPDSALSLSSTSATESFFLFPPKRPPPLATPKTESTDEDGAATFDDRKGVAVAHLGMLMAVNTTLEILQRNFMVERLLMEVDCVAKK